MNVLPDFSLISKLVATLLDILLAKFCSILDCLTLKRKDAIYNIISRLQSIQDIWFNYLFTRVPEPDVVCRVARLLLDAEFCDNTDVTFDVLFGEVTLCALLDVAVRKGCVVERLWDLPSSNLNLAKWIEIIISFLYRIWQN